MPELENVTGTETLLDLDNIDGMSFNDIEDPPEFVTPPDGVYDLLLTKAGFETYTPKGETAKKRRIAHYYEIVGVTELSDVSEQAPKAGDKFSERWQINPEGMKYWKGKAQAILGTEVGNVTVGNVLADLDKGQYRFRAKISNKKTVGKEGTPNAGKEFTNTNVKVIARAGEIPGLGQEGSAASSNASGGLSVE